MNSDRIERLERALSEVQRQIAQLPIRFGDSGVGGDGGTETLGCYLTRSGGSLTINLSALFAEGYEVDDTEPCPRVITGGGGLGIADPPNNSILIFTPGTGKEWQETPKTLVRGYTNAAANWDDAAYSMTVTDVLAGSGEPGAQLMVRKNLGNAALGPLPFGNRRVYRKHEVVFAVRNDTDTDWDDITPGPGSFITAVLTQSVPPAEWNAGGKTLLPKPFQALWYARANGFPGTQPLVYVGPIDAENRSLDGITLSAGKALVVNLAYSDGVFTLPFAADCPTFNY